MIRRLLLVFLLTSFCFWFPTAYKRWTHAFRPAKCLVQWPFMPEWEIDPLPAEKKGEVCAILGKPFSYLTKGAQSYVFLSEDQKYVLKLFRYDTCPIPYGQKFARKVRRWVGAREKHFYPADYKIEKNFTSCKLAYSVAPKQTGVVFVHLNPNGADLPMIKVKDRLGRIHKMDPTIYRFVLQKKVELFTRVLDADDMHPFFDSYLTLLNEIALLGLVNLDIKLESNFGFLDGQAIVMDIGNLIYQPNKAASQAVCFERRLDWWLNKHLLSEAEFGKNR